VGFEVLDEGMNLDFVAAGAMAFDDVLGVGVAWGVGLGGVLGMDEVGEGFGVWVFGVWVVMGFVGMWIGGERGRAGAGLACGLILGPLGWIVAFLLPRESTGKDGGSGGSGGAGGKGMPIRRPGAPTQRPRRLPLKRDPFE
jgi:hypothetical protein